MKHLKVVWPYLNLALPNSPYPNYPIPSTEFLSLCSVVVSFVSAPGVVAICSVGVGV